MSDAAFEVIEKSCRALKLDFNSAELARIATEKGYSEATLDAIADIFNYLREKKAEATIQSILKMSRLPLKNPRTFENFDFSLLRGKDMERLKSITCLSPIYARKNLAFIGPAGVGKTHLAQAFGYACCMHGLKTYFIKMSELRDKFTQARRTGKEASTIASLVSPSCLIIDEVGHCDFDKDNTRLFFDLVDRRYNKEGAYNIVFTSNKTPSRWSENFAEGNALQCALDRIFDDATVFNIRGESFRGKNLGMVTLHTGQVKASTPIVNQTEN